MDNLSERIIQLEIDFGKVTVINENIDKRLILLENMIKENQETINSINHQLVIRNERIKLLKSILAGLAAITATISGLHIKAILSGIFS